MKIFITFLILIVYGPFSLSQVNLDWAVQMDQTSGSYFLNNCRVHAIAEAPDGSIYLGGEFRGNVDFNPYGPGGDISSFGSPTQSIDPFIVKFNSSGVFQWVRRISNPFNPSGDLSSDRVLSIVVDNSGSAYLHGDMYNGRLSTFIAKYSPAGNQNYIIDTEGYSSSKNVRSITIDNLGFIYLFDRFNGTKDLNPGAGVDNHTAGGSSYDAYIAKFNANTGAYVWGKSFGNTNYESAQHIVYNSGQLYVVGSFRETVDFNPDGGVNNLTSPSSSSTASFIARYSASNGAYSYAQVVGDATDGVIARGLAVEGNDLYVTYQYSGTVDFQPGAGTLNLTGTRGGALEGGSLVKYDKNTLAAAWGYETGILINDGTYIDANASMCMISGDTYDTIDIDPTAGVQILKPGSSFLSLAVVAFNPDGTFNFASAPTEGEYLWNPAILDNAGGFFLSGEMRQANIYLDPNATTTVTFNEGSQGDDAYLAHYNLCTSEMNTTSTAAICENQTKALTSSGPGGGIWSVVSGGGTITGTTYTPANISSATTVTVRYVDGCGTGTNRAFTVNPLPTQPGAITGSASICSATNGTYSITAVANASSYTWSYSGNGTVTGTGTSVTLNATTGGTLSVRSDNGCGNSALRTRTITVINTPATPSAISGSNTICSSSQTYSVTNVAGVTYNWTYSGGGTPSGSGNSITLTPTSGGTLSVTATNSCGTSTASNLVIAVDNTTPAAPGVISGASPICSGASQTYSITAVAGASSYTWSYSGGGTATSTTASVTFTPTSSGTLSVTATNACGTSSASTRSIVVDAATPATPSTISGSNTICSSSQTYSVTNVAGVTYSWTYSGGGTPVSSANSVTFTPTSNGTLSVTATNSCGTSAARNLGLTVDVVSPATPGVISGASPICSGASQTYSITAVAGASSYTWSYSGGGTATSTTASVTFTPTSSGTLSVTATNACGTSSASTRSIVVDAATPATPSAIVGNTTICSSAQTYSVTNVAGVTYAWTYSGGGNPLSTTNSVTFTPTSNGTLSVTATNACGTSNATSQAVTVDNAAPATPGTISGTTPVCRASSQTYTIAAVAGASSYTWSYSGGGTATSTTTSVTFSPTSTGILSVTATNGCGTSTARNLSITVDSSFTPSIVSSGFDMCVGNSRNLVGSPVGGTFSIVSGGTFANISGSTLNATAGGSVQIRYRIVNACGNMDQTQNINIVSVANASVTSSTADMCVNDLRMLTATPVGTGGSWSVISGPGYIGLNDTLTSTGAGTVQVRYQYLSACGVSADTVSINVNPLPNVTITSGANDMCAGEAKTLTASPLGGTWTVVTGGGTITAGDYIAPAVASATSVTLRYDYTAGSCSDFDSFSFTVNPTATTPLIVIPPAGGDTICAGSSITVNATVSGTGNTIAWYTNNNPIPNTASGIPIAYGTSMTDNPNAYVTYYAFANTPQGCKSNAYDSVNIYMFAPSASATAITASSDTVCSGQATTLTLSGGALGSGATWRWYEASCGNGLVIGNGTSISVNPTVTTTYLVRAEGSCDTSACVQFTIIVQSSVDATITLPDSICRDGGTVDFSQYINPTSTQGGTWSGPGMTDSIFNPLAAGLGTHTITYTVGSLPCQDVDSRTVTVYFSDVLLISDDFIITTAGNTDTLDLESNDASAGTISIAMLPSNGSAYVDNNKVMYLADPEYRGNDTLTYVVCDNRCLAVCDTATVIIQVDLNIFFDNIDENNNIGKIGVTPNGDGVNDVLYIDDLYNHPTNKITIYNRWGDEIFTKSPYKNDWAPDEKLTKGTYFFVLEFIDTKELYKGIIHLEK